MDPHKETSSHIAQNEGYGTLRLYMVAEGIFWMSGPISRRWSCFGQNPPRALKNHISASRPFFMSENDGRVFWTSIVSGEFAPHILGLK